MRRAGLALWVACAAMLGCGPEVDPYCSEYDDPTGRGIALCRTLSEQPVCDADGDTARFERDSAGMVRLVGGDPAICDLDRQVVCADGTGTPYCLPELAD